MIIALAIIALGFVGLWIASDYLVSCARGLAQIWKLSHLFAGFVIMSVTGLPELAIALQSIFHARPSLSVGNIIGANFVNISLSIGIPLLIFGSIMIQQAVFRKKVGLLMCTAGLMAAIFIKSTITPRFASLLIICYPIVVALLWLTSRNERLINNRNHSLLSTETTSSLIIKFFIATIGLFISTRLIVTHSLLIVQKLSTAPIYFGTTILAIGTSLPEITLNIQAFRKGEYDLALGNAFGSILGVGTVVLGLLALTSSTPITLTGIHHMAYFQAIAYGVLAIGMIRYRRLSKITGAILISTYAAYVILELWLRLV